MLVHNSWPSHAHHLLCMRISAVIQAHNSCCATEDTDCLNNISYLFQQHILTLPTTYPYSSNNKKRVNHKFMTHPPPNQLRWRVVKSVQELFTPRNAHKHWGFRRKGEEWRVFPYPLLTTFLQAFTLTVPIEQPTGERTASQLFFIRQYTISD